MISMFWQCGSSAKQSISLVAPPLPSLLISLHFTSSYSLPVTFFSTRDPDLPGKWNQTQSQFTFQRSIFIISLGWTQHWTETFNTCLSVWRLWCHLCVEQTDDSSLVSPITAQMKEEGRVLKEVSWDLLEKKVPNRVWHWKNYKN